MNFHGYIRTPDGTSQGYGFETGTLSANTWTKIVKTIPGHSNLTFNSDAELGWNMIISMYHGTDYTTSGYTLNQWAAYDSSSRIPDQVSTWYTTNGATWEITGLQLEVGSVATDFEHRSFDQELDLCMRYFQKYVNPKLRGVLAGSGQFQRMGFPLMKRMRSTPSSVWSGTQNVYAGSGVASITGHNAVYNHTDNYEIDAATSGTLDPGTGSAVCAYTGGTEATVTLSAEL